MFYKENEEIIISRNLILVPDDFDSYFFRRSSAINARVSSGVQSCNPVTDSIAGHIPEVMIIPSWTTPGPL